jgi:hypothetical protein
MGHAVDMFEDKAVNLDPVWRVLVHPVKLSLLKDERFGLGCKIPGGPLKAG